LSLGFLDRGAKRVGGEHGLLSRVLSRNELGAQGEQLCSTAQWTRAGRAAGQPHRASCVDERGAVVDGMRLAEKRAHPRATGAGGVDAMRQRVIGDVTTGVLRCVERQQQERPRIRRRVPGTNRVRRGAIAHQYRVVPWRRGSVRRAMRSSGRR
jgi:hypothetical protein